MSQNMKVWFGNLNLDSISGPNAYFSKPIFASAQAGRFEYHEAYKQNIFRSASSSITRVGRNQKNNGKVSNSNNLLYPASTCTLIVKRAQDSPR